MSGRPRGGHKVKHLPRIAFLAVLSASIAGCALLPGGGPAPLDTYVLTAPKIEAGPKSRKQILIPEPDALKALDGERIVIRTTPGSIQYLAGAQWGDRLPRIVQARLAETFQSSGRFAGVGLPGDGLAIDYQVIAELRSFQVDVRGGAHANVEIFVRLLNDRNGTVHASRSFTGTAPLNGTSNAAYAQALDAAFGRVASEIVAWTVSSI